jgi:hypothetical protein
MRFVAGLVDEELMGLGQRSDLIDKNTGKFRLGYSQRIQYGFDLYLALSQE